MLTPLFSCDKAIAAIVIHGRGRMGRTLWLVTLALSLSLCGCASNRWVTLRSTPKSPLTDSLKLLSRGGPRPTARTVQLLRRYDLDGSPTTNYRELIGRLGEILAKEPRAETVYAISELAFLGAKRTELRSRGEALQLYGTSVTHAYLFLFDERFGAEHTPYDPQFRGACDLYNAALEGALRIANRRGSLRPGMTTSIKTPARQMDITVEGHGRSWEADDLDRFEFVSDYQVHGLTNHYHTYGLGVPLIAIREDRRPGDPAERFYPPNLGLPVTAFLRVVSPTDLGGISNNQSVRAQLELHDPLVESSIEVAGRRVPMESDLSTPLAFFLSQPALDDSRLSTVGLLNPEKARGLTGLYMLGRYQPGKIPVVMVHGLWSSPVTWMEMFNDLRSDPAIRDYYQFWFYLYPTGQPFWYSAAQMREDLVATRQVLDPNQQEPALDQMVLVGHSMGGLVSKLQTVQSRDDFWKIVSEQPFEQLQADEQTRATLAKTFFFAPNPSIRRVITIGTPHRGSLFANDATRWLGSKLISIPARMLGGRQELLVKNPGYFRKATVLEVDTSIDSLAPDSPLLPVLLQATRAPWVHYHNIIGKRPDRGLWYRLSGSGDGVVSVQSASLDDSDSQAVVPADHSSVHRHPRSILEVRRILSEHIESLRAFPAEIQRLPRTASHSLEAPGSIRGVEPRSSDPPHRIGAAPNAESSPQAAPRYQPVPIGP